MYTLPLATAGEPTTRPPVVAVHRGEHATTPDEQFVLASASNAYSLPSSEPTYTTPLTTAGDENTSPPVAAVNNVDIASRLSGATTDSELARVCAASDPNIAHWHPPSSMTIATTPVTRRLAPPRRSGFVLGALTLPRLPPGEPDHRLVHAMLHGAPGPVDCQHNDARRIPRVRPAPPNRWSIPGSLGLRPPCSGRRATRPPTPPPLPAPLVRPVTGAARGLLDRARHGLPARPPAPEPVLVAPGSLGSWADVDGGT